MSDESVHICVDLWTKSRFVGRGPVRRPEDLLDASGHCTCARTSQVLGPDRRPVHPLRCQPGRTCFRDAPGKTPG